MMSSHPRKPSSPLDSPRKLVYLVIGVLCLLIGLVGLVLPIIPGVLFLVGAVYLFSKVSRRVRRWSEQSTTYQSMVGRIDRLSKVNMAARVKVVSLMVADVAVGSAETVSTGVQRLRRRFRR